jgi:hypothetical protein
MSPIHLHSACSTPNSHACCFQVRKGQQAFRNFRTFQLSLWFLAHNQDTTERIFKAAFLGSTTTIEGFCADHQQLRSCGETCVNLIKNRGTGCYFY